MKKKAKKPAPTKPKPKPKPKAKTSKILDEMFGPLTKPKPASKPAAARKPDAEVLAAIDGVLAAVDALETRIAVMTRPRRSFYEARFAESILARLHALTTRIDDLRERVQV